MAIDIRAELQSTNDVLIAMKAMAEQAIDDTIQYRKPARWAFAVEFLADLALDRLGDVEQKLNKLMGVAASEGTNE